MAASATGAQWVPPAGTYLVALTPQYSVVLMEASEAQGSGSAPSTPAAASGGHLNALGYTSAMDGAFFSSSRIAFGPDHTIAHSVTRFLGSFPGPEPPFRDDDPTATPQVGGRLVSLSVITPAGSVVQLEIVFLGPHTAGAAPVELAAAAEGGRQFASPDQEAAGRLAAPRARADGGATLFRIARASTNNSRLEVNYSLAAYSKGGPAVREGAVVLPAGSPSVDLPSVALPPGSASPPEIVTLKLRGRGQPLVPGSSLTVFLPGEARRCSEASLLAAHREEGSGQAFAALVERHRGAVLRTCHQVLGSWHDAEDVSQLVFLALAQGKMRLHSTLAGWLAAVARNASLVLLRSRQRRRRHEQCAAQPLSATYEEFTAGLREEVETALSRLPAPLREAVELRYLEGWSQAEAAQLVGCPRGTLSRRASMGLQQLREILGADGRPLP